MNRYRRDGLKRLLPDSTCKAKSDQQGAILVGLIIILTVAAVIGATMSTLTTTSTFTEVATKDTQNAYYMAYSGLKYYNLHPATLQLSSTPIERRLDNGSRFELAIEFDADGQPRPISTGVVTGLFGESRWKLIGTGTPGSISFVDTMEDTDNWSEDDDVLGKFSVEDIDGNSALKLEGESLADSEGKASSDTVDRARQLLVDAANAIANAFSGAGNTSNRDIWQGIAADLENAASMADAISILEAQLGTLPIVGDAQVPQELFEPKAFATFDWRTAVNNSPIPLFDYWSKQNDFAFDPPYDHPYQTLSYDVQAKFAVRPELEHYMAGLSVRLNDTVSNGGEMIGVSIVRGDKTLTDLIPDALVPLDRTQDSHGPLIVVWSAIDTDGNGIITPKWEITISGIADPVLIWPKEREWLAYAQVEDGYCLTESGNQKYFLDWLTLMVRIEEKVLSSGTLNFSAGTRVNALEIFLSTTDSCAGGGASNGSDSFLDNQRGANPRMPAKSQNVRWPVFDVANYADWNDNFTLLGGGSVDLEWTLNPAPETGPAFDIDGQNEKDNAVILVDAETNPAHSSAGYSATSVDDWPAEMGLHMFGEGDPSALAPKIYVDDYGVRLKGPDPDI